MNNSGIYRIVRTNPLVLPASGHLHRKPPRPIHLRQANYDERFDFDTVFCDAFQDRDEAGSDVVVLTGPPLLNLAGPFTEATYSNVASGVVGRASLRTLHNSQHSRVGDLGLCDTMRIMLTDGFSREIPVSRNDRDIFRDRKCLVTISKDNELIWIRDWARYYAEAHGVDAVLLYDNGSTKYSSADVLDALSGVEGIDVAVVVEWPFPFGPQAGNWDGLRGVKWDSSYCQSTLLEHARWRYLNEAQSVLHCDIDELMVSERGTIFDDLAESEGLVYFEGRWIEAIREDGAAGTQRFIDYQWQDDRRPPTTRKWLVDPRRGAAATAWRTHRVFGLEGRLSANTSHRHFRGISTSWKFDRSDVSGIDPAHHVRDDVLVSALQRVFGEGDTPDFDDHRPLTSTTVRGRIRDEATKLSPAPSSVKFTGPDVLHVRFETSGVRLGIDVRFHGAQVTTRVHAADTHVADCLSRHFGGDGPWELDTDTMRRRTKKTVADNVIRHLQARLTEILTEVHTVQAEPDVTPAATGPYTAWRRLCDAVRRFRERLG
jgi:hypothetical protein